MRTKLIVLALCSFFTITTIAGLAFSAEQNPSKLVGTWKLVSGKYNGQVGDFGKLIILKHITGTHFMWVRYDADTKKISQTAGGLYTIKGETYTEHPSYGIGDNFDVIRDTDHSFQWKIVGDKWYTNGQLSNGTKIEEVWELVKPETTMAPR